MTEQSANDLQAKTAGHEVRGVGVAVVMKAVVLKTCPLGDISPKLLDALKRFVRSVAGKQILLGDVGAISHFGEQRQSRRGQGKVLCPLLLRMVRRLGPDTAFKIDFGPMRRKDFTDPRAGEELKLDSVGRTLVRMFRKNGQQPGELIVWVSVIYR